MSTHTTDAIESMQDTSRKRLRSPYGDDDEVEDGELAGEEVQDGELAGEEVQDGELVGEEVQDGEVAGEEVQDGELAGEELEEGEIPPSPKHGKENKLAKFRDYDVVHYRPSAPTFDPRPLMLSRQNSISRV
jgi:hypothetical protein